MKHKVPEFLSPLPSEEKQRLMKKYLTWKGEEITELMVKHYEKKLEQLLIEDEKDSPLSWFQSKWTRAKRLGKREAIRKFIEHLKE